MREELQSALLLEVVHSAFFTYKWASIMGLSVPFSSKEKWEYKEISI